MTIVTRPKLKAVTVTNPGLELDELPLFDRSKWETVKFGDVVKCLKEQVDPESGEIERYVAGEHMDTADVHIRRWGTVGDGYLGPAFIRRFRKGQVLYGSRRTYLKKVSVADFDGVTANTTLVLQAREGLLQELLPWIMLSDKFTEHSVRESKGSVNPYINWSDIAWFEFALPPRDQQRRIAELLWAVDENATHNDVLIAQLHSARTALLDGLIPSPESDNRGSFVAMKDIATMQNGRPFPSTDYQEDGIRLIRPGNLGINGFLQWPESATVCMPTSYLKDNKDWLVGADQVVINLTAQSLEDGFMGRACITRQGEEGFLNQRIGRFILSDAILPRFFWRCLQTKRFRQLVEGRCEGSKVRHTYFRHFADFAIPMLNIEAQLQIVDQIDAVDEAIEQANINGRAIQDLCRALINGVITSA